MARVKVCSSIVDTPVVAKCLRDLGLKTRGLAEEEVPNSRIDNLRLEVCV